MSRIRIILSYHILICYITNYKIKKDCATKRGSLLKVKFFGHCAKSMAAQHRISFDLIWEFTMTSYASDIVSFYVAYQYNIKASYSDMLLNNMQKLENCVCKTQVMPPCPKTVLSPCPILTHDPQHIQSILETNV